MKNKANQDTVSNADFKAIVEVMDVTFSIQRIFFNSTPAYGKIKEE